VFDTVGGDDRASAPAAASAAEPEPPPLDRYLAQWARNEYEEEEKFSTIQKLARTGKSDISPMGTRKPFPNLETILFRGAQFARFPLDDHEPVSTRTVIGPAAEHPLELEIPFYVSHMSFGALSKEAKIALAMGSSQVGTAMCSGEGGMLPEEREQATRYVYEIGTAAYSRNEDAIRRAEAVEIKIGQAAKPGMGGHLPAEKVTPEIAAIRGLKPGQASIAPNRQPDVDSPESLAKLVTWLRELSGGKPIGVKFAAGRIEGDLEFVLPARPDFVTIDCRGGSTGAAPTFIRDNVCLPPIYAIRRARRFLDEAGSQITLCVAGGFRDSTDIAKALALGADAVALATASLIAIGCQQYRICNTGNCPVGITTQDPELRARLSIPASVQRFVHFYRTTRDELETLARVSGRRDVHDLDLSDIFTINSDVARNTDVEFA
jgi:glutamate synthase domain-containing protein 2